MASTAQTKDISEQKLDRGLSNRHLQMIAIGGAIGTGLFFGSGKLISLVGPSVIFIYMVIGFVLFFVMRALGELLLSNLNYKTFGDIAKDLIGPWAGFSFHGTIGSRGSSHVSQISWLLQHTPSTLTPIFPYGYQPCLPLAHFSSSICSL